MKKAADKPLYIFGELGWSSYYFLTSLNKTIPSPSINKIAAISSNFSHPLTDTFYYYKIESSKLMIVNCQGVFGLFLKPTIKKATSIKCKKRLLSR